MQPNSPTPSNTEWIHQALSFSSKWCSDHIGRQPLQLESFPNSRCPHLRGSPCLALFDSYELQACEAKSTMLNQFCATDNRAIDHACETYNWKRGQITTENGRDRGIGCVSGSQRTAYWKQGNIIQHTSLLKYNVVRSCHGTRTSKSQVALGPLVLNFCKVGIATSASHFIANWLKIFASASRWIHRIGDFQEICYRFRSSRSMSPVSHWGFGRSVSEPQKPNEDCHRVNVSTTSQRQLRERRFLTFHCINCRHIYSPLRTPEVDFIVFE